MVSLRISLVESPSPYRTQREHHRQALSLAVPVKIRPAKRLYAESRKNDIGGKSKTRVQACRTRSSAPPRRRGELSTEAAQAADRNARARADLPGRAAARHHRARRLGCLRQEWCHPTPHRKARPALGAGLADRPAHPGGAGPPLSLALLAEAAAARPVRDLRPYLVRPGPRRTRRRPIPTERVAARLRRDQRLREDARR